MKRKLTTIKEANPLPQSDTGDLYSSVSGLHDLEL